MYDKDVFVNGSWEVCQNKIEVEDCTDRSTFGKISEANEKHINKALSGADEANDILSQTTVPERVKFIEAIIEELEACRTDLVSVITKEAGKPISQSRGEYQAVIERFERAKGEIRSLTGEHRVGTTEGHSDWNAVVKHEPIGTVAVIGPYNYPIGTATLSIAPALAAGNSVIFKPSTKTPISGAILSECIVRAMRRCSAIPQTTYSFVPGKSRIIGEELNSDSRVDMISMTGSSSAGARVADDSGITKLHMELGGNAPAIILPDSDIEEAVTKCAKGCFKYAGQRCSAVSRILVHENCYQEFVELFNNEMANWSTGDLFNEETSVGPLIDESQASWVEKLIEDAIDLGATCFHGGDRNGAWFEPTMLTETPHNARIMKEEQFGPVAVITPVESIEEAVELSNSGELALDACIFTNKHDTAMWASERIDAGAVRINGVPSHGIGDIPFGGNKMSGIGRQGLHTTIEEMTREKSIIL